MGTMTKPVILTGIRANNDLTLGNYFGGMMPIIDMARAKSDDCQINMFIPDLHSFTTPIDHAGLYEQILQTARMFVAAGLPLDNDNIFLYRQSFVPAHSELTWILDCFTGFGQMERMTQFKDKSNSLSEEKIRLLENHYGAPKTLQEAHKILFEAKQAENAVSVGLFNYPVLMDADILLYGAAYVPVGDDQTQHLEFTRDIAERMNSRFGELFVVPEPVAKQHEFFGKDQGLRIMDLQNPTKKMSKSDESGKGVIFLNDTPEAAAQKIMSAATDSVGAVHYDKTTQPGISNLLEIHALLSNEPLEKVIAHHDDNTKYGDFKKEIAEQVSAFLSDFQAKLVEVNDQALLAKLTKSEVTMNNQASETLLRVQKAVGLRK